MVKFLKMKNNEQIEHTLYAAGRRVDFFAVCVLRHRMLRVDNHPRRCSTLHRKSPDTGRNAIRPNCPASNS